MSANSACFAATDPILTLTVLQILVKYIVKPSEEEDFVKASPCTLCDALPDKQYVLVM